MSYLWWLLGLEQYEDEDEDPLKDKQKHLKYLCCKNIENNNIPALRGKLSSFLHEPLMKKNKKKSKNAKLVFY